MFNLLSLVGMLSFSLDMLGTLLIYRIFVDMEPNGNSLLVACHTVYLYSLAGIASMFAQPTPDVPLLELPLFLSPVVCGFPSPAQDDTEQTIDLNQLCVAHPAATYFVRAAGDSMVDHGIRDGDLLADFTPANLQQGDLFVAQPQSPRSEALMQVIDKINQGRLGKVYFAARGQDTREWMMKREQLSPRYTTALGELPVVK
jgi:hypothetical protein